MTNFKVWLSDSWKKLVKDYQDNIFTPYNESNIVAHLYHTLILNKPDDGWVNTQYGIGNSKIDLVLVKYIDGEILPVLPVEVKETGTASKNHNQVDRRIKKDVKKLLRHKTSLTSCTDTKPAMIFFYRGTRDRCLDPHINIEMEKVQEMNPEIVFLWGP